MRTTREMGHRTGFKPQTPATQPMRTALCLVAVTILLTPLSGCSGSSPSWERVGPSEFEEAMASNGDGFLLDVRTPSEWEEDGYLEGATLIPHSELRDREGELPEDKEAPVLLYCRSGNRSQQAAATLQDLGFTDIIELESGITGWKDAGKVVSYD